MEYPPFRFSSLLQMQHSDVSILNRAHGFLADSEDIKTILKNIANVLLQYDIYNLEDIELTVLVKPVGHIGKPQVRHLTQPSISIGRTNENDIPLKSPIVSKKHAGIFRRGLEYYLKDLNSDNGTFLNQVKLDPGSEVILKNDDVIRIEPFEVKIGLPEDVSIVKKPLKIDLAEIRVTRNTTMSRHVSAFFQVGSSQETVALVVEEQPARWFIQKIFILQQDGLLTPWTDIETGFLEYMSCKILSVVNPLLKETRLVLQSVEKDESIFREWFSKHAPLVEASFSMQTEIGMVLTSFFIPDKFLGGYSSSVDFLLGAPWLANLSYEFAVEVGVAYLAMDQIRMVEEGDIILLDRSTVALEGEQVSGKAELRSGRMRRGVMKGNLYCQEDGKITITVEGVFQEGLKGMTESNKKQENSEAGSQEVLSSIEIPVTVEFARLHFTLEELSAFKEGQVIEIDKSRPEMVDLSVDGKVIANGTLVDVEGKLGVQIGKIIRSKPKE